MIIQSLAKMCINDNDKCVRYTSNALDWITAIALFVLGMLAACGTIHLHHALTYSLLGAGIVYTLAMLLNTSLEIKVRCQK